MAGYFRTSKLLNVACSEFITILTEDLNENFDQRNISINAKNWDL
jgi:hypothetical protein